MAAVAVAAAAARCRVALCQLMVGSDKAANLASAVAKVAEAARGGANIVALPECFNSPYATDQFPVYAEPIPARRRDIDPVTHVSVAALSEAAAANRVYLVGGELRRRRQWQRQRRQCAASGGRL